MNQHCPNLGSCLAENQGVLKKLIYKKIKQL